MTNVLRELYDAREKIALHLLSNEIYLPIFERLEHEIALEEAKNDAISPARALLERQKAIA